MSPVIDFSKVESLEPVPPGTYEAEVVLATEGVSKAQNPKINLRWKILTGPFEGRLIFDDMTFAENSLWRVKQALTAMSFPDDFNGEITPEDLLGRQATVTVMLEDTGNIDPTTNEPYPARNKVSRYKPAQASAFLLGK